jgi:hypothetical protein
MLYVMTARFREGLTRAERQGALARRASWSYPGGVTAIGEYWPASDRLSVLAIVETDMFGSLFEVVLEWQDVLQIEFMPAITAEDGLKIGPELMSRVSST